MSDAPADFPFGEDADDVPRAEGGGGIGDEVGGVGLEMLENRWERVSQLVSVLCCSLEGLGVWRGGEYGMGWEWEGNGSEKGMKDEGVLSPF